jgi:subtilase family serine protease
LASEVAWEYSGGGASSYAPMPTYQSAYLPAGFISANNGMRAVPDVAAVADGQHSAFGIYWKEQWGMAGGTSMATPLWAGLSALLAEYLANKGESFPALIAATPGGFNGLLYQMSLTQGNRDSFYDISGGSNNVIGSSCPLCIATPGYNDVTGLGAPDAVNLFSHL